MNKDERAKVRSLKALLRHYEKQSRSLKLFKFTIGPYEFLKKESGYAWLHLFVIAKSKAEAIRLKRAQDRKCDPKLSVRGRRHKWHVLEFRIGEVVLA